MKFIYRLTINCENGSSIISNVLGIDPSEKYDKEWIYEVIQHENDEYHDFINKFLDMLDGNYSKLQDVGVNIEDITIWMLYEYNQQCNMEFSPEQMKRIGDAGIALCISCWQA
ncbi:MAG: hypothetical protein JEZ02_11065 [Desulfatibacillum sp.]|nr:hypothetical protein [Desulfatibacillum sp.]